MTPMRPTSPAKSADIRARSLEMSSSETNRRGAIAEKWSQPLQRRLQ